MGCLVLGAMVHRTYVNFGLRGAGNQIYLQLSISGTLCGSVQKWLLLVNMSNFPCGVLQMIIILNEMTAAVQPCPLAMTYAAKSGIRATATVVLLWAALQRGWLKHSNWCYLCSCTLQRDWLKHENSLQIAPCVQA